MMTTDDLETYLNLLVQDLTSRGMKRALLLCDSWSSNKNQKLWIGLQKKYESQIVLEKLIIPEGTTGLVQPLDVFYFRQFKSFVRRVSDSLDLVDKIWQRDKYFALQAFVHFQFGAPQFRDMIKYSFYASRYLDQRPNRFETPAEVCFKFSKLERCSSTGCSKYADICCAHCSSYLCYQHCILESLHINCNKQN